MQADRQPVQNKRGADQGIDGRLAFGQNVACFQAKQIGKSRQMVGKGSGRARRASGKDVGQRFLRQRDHAAGQGRIHRALARSQGEPSLTGSREAGQGGFPFTQFRCCLLYTSDAADD